MGFRITMGMKMNSYRYNLMQSTNTLASAEEKVTTHRKFNSYAESPAAATNAWRVRRNYMDNEGYIKETNDTTTRYQTAWMTMGSVKTTLEQYTGKTSIIRAANDPTGEAKKELGNVLSNTADTVIQAINGAKYGEEFVFGGTNGTTPPFSWEGSKLLYRGINLTPPSMMGGSKRWPDSWGHIDEETNLPENKDFEPLTETLTSTTDADGNVVYTHTYTSQQRDANGELMYHPDGSPVEGNSVTETLTTEERDWYVYFQNVSTLNKLSDETQYADLGMGLNEEDGKLVNGTYFNNAIPGINMLGYGVDDDGDPKNLALLFKEFDRVLATVDSNGTVDESEGGNKRVIELLGKFDEVCDFTLKGYTTVDTQASFLKANSETLDGQKINLNEQILNIEQVDMADAITQFLWDYNCYSAALKIGTQLLSQSLLDYMN